MRYKLRTLMILLAAAGLWSRRRWLLRALVAAAALPFVANSAGWIFTVSGSTIAPGSQR